MVAKYYLLHYRQQTYNSVSYLLTVLDQTAFLSSFLQQLLSSHLRMIRNFKSFFLLLIALVKMPLLAQCLSLKKNQLHFFNNAGASPSAPKVLETIHAHLQLEICEGGYGAANTVKEDGRLDHVYSAVANLINASSPMEVALVESATVAWTRAFYSMADYILEKSLLEFKETPLKSAPLERVILVSEAEYAANIVAIVKFCSDQNRRYGEFVQWKVYLIPSTKSSDCDDEEESTTGIIDVGDFRMILAGSVSLSCIQEVKLGNDNDKKGIKSADKLLDPSSIAIVCVTHIPTNSGIINPVCEVGKLIEDYNMKSRSASSKPQIFYLVDACQSVGQIAVDVQEMRAHAISATGRKYLRGPRGTGFLYMVNTLTDYICPIEVDHVAAPISFKIDESGGLAIDIKYSLGARRFEYFESNISSRLGLGAAIDHLNESGGISKIESQIKGLASKLRKLLQNIDNVVLYHNHKSVELCGIVSFKVRGIESYIIKEAMATSESVGGDRFELSVVPRTSTPIDSSNTKTCDLVRASLTYFNTDEEIERFEAKLRCFIEDIHKTV